MISPFKAVIGDSYKAVEPRLLAAIHLRFGLPPELPDDCRKIVKAPTAAPPISKRRGSPASRTTRRAVSSGRRRALAGALERDYLTPWPAETAEARYLERFDEALTKR